MCLSASLHLVTVALDDAVAAAVGILTMLYPDSEKLPSPYGQLFSLKGENMLILRDAHCLEAELSPHSTSFRLKFFHSPISSPKEDLIPKILIICLFCQLLCTHCYLYQTYKK